MGLTVVKSDRVIQAAQLLQSGMHHPCSVTGNRQCLRLSIMTYGSQPLLVPVTRVKWDRSNVSALHQARWEVSEAGTFTVQGQSDYMQPRGRGHRRPADLTRDTAKPLGLEAAKSIGKAESFSSQESITIRDATFQRASFHYEDNSQYSNN